MAITKRRANEARKRAWAALEAVEAAREAAEALWRHTDRLSDDDEGAMELYDFACDLLSVLAGDGVPAAEAANRQAQRLPPF